MSSLAIGVSVSATRAAASLLSSRTRMRAPPRSSAGSLPGRWAKRPQTSSRSCSSSIIRLRRTSERTRAKSAMSLTGLVRKSSAPASSPVSRSAASDRAVTMTTGICAVVGSALSRRQTSKPSISGIMTARRTRSGSSARHRRSAEAPSAALRTSKYSLASLAPSSLTLTSTSSTTRMRADIEAASAQKALDRLEEIGDGNRLGDIGLAAALANLLLVALHGEGGDGDDRNRAQLVVFLDPFRHLQPRYLGQLDIHQDQVGTMRTGDLERLHAVLGLQGVVTVRFEQVVEELHVELVILDDENGLRLGARPQGMHCLGSVHAAPVPMPPLDRRSFLNHHC